MFENPGRITLHFIITGCFLITLPHCTSPENGSVRERVSLNDNWTFYKYGETSPADSLIYDALPVITRNPGLRIDGENPSEQEDAETTVNTLKDWILPTANPFIKNPGDRHDRPAGNPGSGFPFVSEEFDDNSWEKVDLPHDWAIAGPFFEGRGPIGGIMGRLPSPGTAWYRKKLDIPESDSLRQVYLDVDGAMSYAMVWLNGSLVGGWPYGYASWRLDLTPYLKPGGENQLAIRLDNPENSSRWYPGEGSTGMSG